MFTMTPQQKLIKGLNQWVSLLKTLEDRGGLILGSSLLIANSFSIRDFVLLTMVNTST